VPDLPAHGSRFRETPLTLDNAVDTLHEVIQKEAAGKKVGGHWPGHGFELRQNISRSQHGAAACLYPILARLGRCHHCHQ
jgi:hypothetical protein